MSDQDQKNLKSKSDDEWRIDGYEFNENELLSVLKKSLEENDSHFHHIFLKDLEKVLREIANSNKEMMFYPITDEIDEIIEKLGEFKIYNLKINSDKKDIRDVKIGITGADAIAAETGSIIIYDRDSLKSIASFMPEIHIVIGKRSLVFSNIMDALGFLFKNNEIKGTVQIIQGPSKTGDIEKKIVRPSHGPKEFHVIVIDDL